MNYYTYYISNLNLSILIVVIIFGLIEYKIRNKGVK